MLPPREDIQYLSTKTYTHSVGLSACFRQHKADSHCKYLHGYALEIRLAFVADNLDEKNWVVDFGSLKTIKAYLEGRFDHKTLVAEDDPELETFQSLQELKIIDMLLVPATGCEAFARIVFDEVEDWLQATKYTPRVSLESIEVREHAGNSAIVRRKVTP
jgi:6-pyruvoyltetrahydropterin/6-carboxytetrahydropterin synthase